MRTVLWVLGLVLSGTAHALSGIVTHVTDGDTIWVRPDEPNRKPVKLRLVGIDAPERCQAWGAQATAALTSQVHVFNPNHKPDHR